MQSIKYVLFYFVTLLSLSTHAQTSKDPIYFNFSQLPQTNFAESNGNLTTFLFECNVAYPILKIGKNLKIFNAIYYKYLNADYSILSAHNQPFPTSLHDARYSAIIRTQLSEKWEIVSIPRLIIRSDLRQPINRNDFFSQVTVFATYAVKGNPNFKIGIGGALNNDFARNAIVPLGSLYYESKKVRIEILPPNANFLYKKSENLEFGIFASLDFTTSRVSPFEIANDDINYLRIFQLFLAPTVTRRLYKQLFGHLKIGFVPIRNLEPLYDNFEVLTNKDFDLEPNIFFRTGISFRLKD
jgi:hypothetical protein